MNNTKERIASSYTTARFNLDYQIDEWRISAFINNASDKKAFTITEPASRRTPKGDVAVLAPRSMEINVTYSF